MRMMSRKLCLFVVAISFLATGVSGCGLLRRLSEVGDPPPMDRMRDPTTLPDYTPITLPMPPPVNAMRQANSLWRPGSRAFFKDQRGSRMGDIINVDVQISDSATLNNNTNRSREGNENLGINNVLGLERSSLKFLPDSFNPANAVDIGSTSDTTNGGSISRNEAIKLRVAAVITQMLPNGNMVLYGRQQVRVNSEVRELAVSGIIRPQDVRADNSVRFNQMAEARVSYGGRGTLSDIQQPRYGQEILDILLPF